MSDIENNNLQTNSSKNEQSKNEQSNDSFPEENLKKIAEKKPEKFLEVMAMEMSSQSGSLLHRKMTEKHIDKVLDLAAKHDERDHDVIKRSQENEHVDNKENRRYLFWTFVICVLLTLAILYIFKDKSDVLIPILTGLGGLFGGTLGGYGIGKSKKS